MRLSCATSPNFCPQSLFDALKVMGIKPIVTHHVVRVVYEGDDEALGDTIVYLFEQLPFSDIVVDRKRKGVKKREKA